MNRFSKYILFFLLGGICFTSCKDKEDSEENNSSIENMEYKAEKIKLKIQYSANTNTEVKRETWKYNSKKQVTEYEIKEDGELIEKHSDFIYGKDENNNSTQTFIKTLYFQGVKYITETITNTFSDSVGGKLIQNIVEGKEGIKSTVYTYNETGLLDGMQVKENNVITRTYTAYDYKDKTCTFIEGYSALGSWTTKKHEVVYANKSYSIVAEEVIFKENHDDIKDERTVYKYDNEGQLIEVNSFFFWRDNSDKWNDTYIEKPSYSLTNFVYTSNGVTYTRKNYIDESDSGKIEETYLE